MNAPNHVTHIPVTVELPEEPKELASGRADAPTPSIWQPGVKCTRKTDGRRAVVVRIDRGTNMFRAFYPDEGEYDREAGKYAGRFSERTEWEHIRNWDPEVTMSPAEKERQTARITLEDEMALLEPDEVEDMKAILAGVDPVKALAMLKAFQRRGVIKGKPAAVAAAVSDPRGKK